MAHSLDIGKNRFRTLVTGAAVAQPQLPLVHTTDIYFFEDVLEDGELAPQYCKVFSGEILTYFFYGRPAFRPNIDAQPTTLMHYFPVCLVFKPEWTVTIKRVFPFDSGAFQNGLYGAYLHDKMKLSDFGLEADLTIPGKVISQFFGSVPAYLKADPSPVAAIDPAEFEAQSYLALINAKDGNSIDSRGSGIELQTADVAPLAGALAAVVMPSTFADGSTGAKLAALKVDVLPYPIYGRMRPSEFMSTISTLCFDYYVRTGLIDARNL